MNLGWIKLWRIIFGSSLWMMRPEDRILAITLMLLANPKDKLWLNKWTHTRVTVKRGELIASYTHLARDSNLTVRNIRTSLKNLCDDQFCEIIKSCREGNTRPDTALTRQFTHIKILKYDEYQKDVSNSVDGNDSQPNTAPNTAPHQKLTTTKEERRQEDKKKEKHTPPSGECVSLSKNLLKFKEITGYIPDDPEIQKKIESCMDQTNLQRAKEAFTQWKCKGYRADNLDWLFDWSINGIPQHKRKKQNHEDDLVYKTAESNEVMKYFNEKYQKQFLALSYHGLINQLISKKYTVDQIKRTVDYRYDELQYEDEGNKWFTPKVIFKLENFEVYFNECYTTMWKRNR